MYRDVFRAPSGIAYNTGVERAFLQSKFSMTAKADKIVGCGVDLPAQYSNGSTTTTKELSRNDDNSVASTNYAQSTATAFRRRHRLYGPFALYGGRIDPGKGCEELIAHFGSYASKHGDATLALMGVKLMPIPEEPYIRFAGLLSENERLEALHAANVVIVPSPYESLSLLALESFAVGTPILANARSDVVTDHCQRSNAGLYYADQNEFLECLQLLMTNEDLRSSLGTNGQAYVKENYEWDVIMKKYDYLLQAVTGKRISQSARSRRPRASSKSSRNPRSRNRGRSKPNNNTGR